MDNNMAAIVSLVNLMLGFVCGYAVSLVVTLDESSDLKVKLVEKQKQIRELQDTIVDLQNDLDDEQTIKKRLLRRLHGIFHDYSDLPPPQGPLMRSRACSDSDSDEDKVNYPVSPEPNSEHKD